MSDLTLAVKSTIDKIGNDLAATLSIPHFIDLDDVERSSNILAGTDSAVVWKLMFLDEEPRDPMYNLSFMIGVKTSEDPASYDLLGFISAVKETFPIGDSIPIMDWSTNVTPTVKLGSAYITVSGVEPQVTERASGVRLLSMEARVLRYL